MADRLVVDASVVAKWFLKDELEADVDLADGLLVACWRAMLICMRPRRCNMKSAAC